MAKVTKLIFSETCAWCGEYKPVYAYREDDCEGGDEKYSYMCKECYEAEYGGEEEEVNP